MKNKENISRREALKRMSKTAVAVAVAAVLPPVQSLAANMTGEYVDRCYNNYTNYDNYSNHRDYHNYGDYKDYSNYRDYSNYNDYQNAQ